MLPGSFVERKRACGRPNCHCADGKRLHSQYQISVLLDGKPKTLNIPAKWVEKVYQKIEMRRRFEAAAATICSVNLKRFLQEKLKEKEFSLTPAAVLACRSAPLLKNNTTTHSTPTSKA
jgi:gluconate kinase